MLRILKQLILTAVLAIFASQASAMFIQPDWIDPTESGVGTNRYSYSSNDPVNLKDPNGNFFIPGAIIGALGGIVTQGLADVISGNRSSFSEFARAAAIGAAAGTTGGLAGGVVTKGLASTYTKVRKSKAIQHANILGGAAGGAVGGATGSVVDQATEGGLTNLDLGSVDGGQVVNDAAKGAIAGGVLGSVQLGVAVDDSVSQAIPGALGKFVGDVASTITDILADTAVNEGLNALDDRLERAEEDKEDGGYVGF